MIVISKVRVDQGEVGYCGLGHLMHGSDDVGLRVAVGDGFPFGSAMMVLVIGGRLSRA